MKRSLVETGLTRSRSVHVFICAAAVLLCSPAAVHADALRITSGRAFLDNVGLNCPGCPDDERSIEFTLIGDNGLTLRGVGFDFIGSVSEHELGESPFADLSTDVQFPHGFLLPDFGEIGGEFTFMAPRGGATCANLDDVSSCTALAPFTFTGMLDGVSARLFGSGVATASFTGNGFLETVEYQFGARATPEPASLLLVTTGLLARAARQRVRSANPSV